MAAVSFRSGHKDLTALPLSSITERRQNKEPMEVCVSVLNSINECK